MARADRILVIDDDALICDLVSGLARSMGLNCATSKDAANLADALDPDPSVILLDLMMPGMDGIEVLRDLGRRHCRSHILLMSGMDRRILEMAEKLAHSLGLSVVGHLQKPFPLPELKAMLEALASKDLPAVYAEVPKIAIPDEHLRAAIESNQFLNHYQPQIDIRTGRVTGVEALARWQHPDRGLVLPEHFIARIEALGLIDSLCWSTAMQALDEARSFLLTDGQPARLSINASMYSLSDLAFPDTILEMAKRFDFPTDKLAIEITESRLANELSRTLDVLTRLRMKGFQLAIDDFGTGYAMMRQLQNVPATELKIDKSIVENMHLHESDRVMVEKIVEMGHDLHMHVIAEGVMLTEQLNLLREIGCDGAQGYLFSRPISAAQMKGWLEGYAANPLVVPR